MARTRYRAGMDAFPLLLSDESEVSDESEDAAVPTLLWQIMYTEACLMRSAALLRAGRARLHDTHERLRQTHLRRVLCDA
jgi:hypothetical protein